MASKETVENDKEAADAAPEEEASVTMLDVLEQEKAMEEEYAAVLGGSDEKCCTYTRGLRRQALYSCITCCPESRDNLDKCAGICLACSYRCHENHELVELYTKRNFRCDCPTERFAATHRCMLNPTLSGQQPRNANNSYNQNFQGVYCTCHRPYPDPDRTEEEEMLQCAICEDWYHLQHLNVPAVAAKLVDACSEMICSDCMERHAFLRDYAGLSLKALEDADESQANITVGRDSSLLCEENDNKLRSDLDKSISEIMNMGGADGDGDNVEPTTSTAESSKQPASNASTAEDEPDSKRAKMENCAVGDDNSEAATEKPPTCRRPSAQKNEADKGATFWGSDWRAALCLCDACQAMYRAQHVEFLMDAEDLAKTYVERGMRRVAAETSSYEQGIRALASIGRVQQIDAITEYNRMKDKLKEYLQTFAVSKTVVTEADINRFFEEMRNEKNAQVGQPYLCR